jgi:signal transduction histidine kinase
MKPMPLKWRISLLACLVLAVVVVVICVVAYHEMEESLVHNLDRSLKQMARAIGMEVEEGRPPETMRREIQVMLNGVDPGGDVHYRVWIDGQTDDLLAGDPPDSGVGRSLRDLPAGRRDRPHHLFTRTINGMQYRVTWLREDIAGRPHNILVAHRLNLAEHEMAEFLRLLIALGLLVVVGSFAVATLLLLWGLRPLKLAAARLREIRHPGVGGQTLRESQVPAELDPFKDAVVGLLERTDELLRRQQEFSADASHELRTPLTLVKSSLQAVRMRDRDASTYCRAIDDALGDLGRMESLIEQLLAMARLDSAADVPVPAPVDVGRVLRSVADEFSESQVRTNEPIGLSPIIVRGCENQLSRLFRNLVDNAVRHGPAGGPVTVSIQPDGNNTCIIGVHDTGGRIPQSDIDKLFGRFYRTDASRARATGGAGLGLAIARAIVIRHGGQIDLTSSPDAGTNVRVRLPVEKA